MYFFYCYIRFQKKKLTKSYFFEKETNLKIWFKVNSLGRKKYFWQYATERTGELHTWKLQLVHNFTRINKEGVQLYEEVKSDMTWSYVCCCLFLSCARAIELVIWMECFCHSFPVSHLFDDASICLIRLRFGTKDLCKLTQKATEQKKQVIYYIVIKMVRVIEIRPQSRKIVNRTMYICFCKLNYKSLSTSEAWRRLDSSLSYRGIRCWLNCFYKRE